MCRLLISPFDSLVCLENNILFSSKSVNVIERPGCTITKIDSTTLYHGVALHLLASNLVIEPLDRLFDGLKSRGTRLSSFFGLHLLSMN